MSNVQCIPSPGDIGGQMGLFIGASILTILELFDYLYEVRSSNVQHFESIQKGICNFIDGAIGAFGCPIVGMKI